MESEKKGDLTWEEVEPIFRPKGVHMGIMEFDADVCSQCGNCILNCPFKALEEGEDGTPQLREGYACFSCYNCMVTCGDDAVTIGERYHVTEGVFKSDPLIPNQTLPRKAKDENDQPVEWNQTERLIFERRSVRNFKPDPVPETLIRRVLEAGRFAPSGGNCQPWKFIVVEEPTMIDEMNSCCSNFLTMFYGAYRDDNAVKMLVPSYQEKGTVGSFDPRIVLGGAGAIAKGELKTFLNAPVIILLAGDRRSIGGTELPIGICGQNMNLAAQSLGLGFCWIGFARTIEKDPKLKEKLGLKDPWVIQSACVLGYPDFKQSGLVPRDDRPVTWFKKGSSGASIDEA
ncbi:MAG: 4Fe-4S binding protein [Deltaproteobacteria bacterium]|nr:4Fe-4S binding protein [Deltaproteobacteria bacterium]MBT4639745.1 4Fe-4S binding protein [Deltaproteobacteria bacterium]MBT6504961.1 4Fe-4S binding protein [Deltaproteobacteria bacterium]